MSLLDGLRITELQQRAIAVALHDRSRPQVAPPELRGREPSNRAAHGGALGHASVSLRGGAQL